MPQAKPRWIHDDVQICVIRINILLNVHYGNGYARQWVLRNTIDCPPNG